MLKQGKRRLSIDATYCRWLGAGAEMNSIGLGLSTCLVRSE